MDSVTNWFGSVGSQITKLSSVVQQSVEETFSVSSTSGTNENDKSQVEGGGGDQQKIESVVKDENAKSPESVAGTDEAEKLTEEGKPMKSEPTESESPSGSEKLGALADLKNLYSTDSVRNLGGYITNFADKASKTVTEAAQQLKQTVEDKTILGDFQKEQERFIAESGGTSATSTTALAPWVGCVDETALKKQILSLSLDSRNFLRDPPAGTQFQFVFSESQATAIATLEEDPNLSKMRFALVPKQISEESFWRNYFYRVSLIKQAMQLKNMNAADAQNPGPSSAASTASNVENKENGKKEKVAERKKIPSDSSPVHLPSDEFVSDTVHSEVNEAELEQVRAALGLTPTSNGAKDDKADVSSPPASPDHWEDELVAELNDYELVGEKAEKNDDEWEKEISELLDQEIKS